MNKMFKLFALIGVLLVVISCHSCGKDDPLPPTPPEKPIRFSTEQVDLTLENNSTSVTLENFKGTLTQDGQVTGFKVSITGNIIRITAEQYVPGDYTFIFKGNGKSYPLKVRLQKMPEMRLTGVFTSTGEELIRARFTSKKFDQGRLSRFAVSSNQDNPKEQYVLISDIQISGKEISFTLKAHGIQKMSDGARYLPDGEQRGLKGSIISEPSDAMLRIYAKLSNGKGINIVILNLWSWLRKLSISLASSTLPFG